jgi:hypothetical protein
MYVARQSADVTFNADTTLDDLTDLNFPIGASQVWFCIGASGCISNTTPDVKYTLTAPSGATGRFGVLGPGVGITALSSETFGDPVAIAIPDNIDQTVFLWAMVVNSTNAGTCQWQAAQNTSNASNTIFYQDSGLVAVRLF